MRFRTDTWCSSGRWSKSIRPSCRGARTSIHRHPAVRKSAVVSARDRCRDHAVRPQPGDGEYLTDENARIFRRAAAGRFDIHRRRRAPVPDSAFIADGPAAFVAAARAALVPDPARIVRGEAAARAQSWDAIAERMWRDVSAVAPVR